MKTIVNTLFLLLIVTSFSSCGKDPLDLPDAEENCLYFDNHKAEMNVSYYTGENSFDIDAESKDGFFGATYVFRFRHIPYEVMGKTIELDKTSEFTLSFEILRHVQWFTSPERVCGVILEDETTEYKDKSPFKNGQMRFTEDETGLTFTLCGELRNGRTIRMKLVVPSEKLN